MLELGVPRRLGLREGCTFPFFEAGQKSFPIPVDADGRRDGPALPSRSSSTDVISSTCGVHLANDTEINESRKLAVTPSSWIFCR